MARRVVGRFRVDRPRRHEKASETVGFRGIGSRPYLDEFRTVLVEMAEAA